MILARRVFFLFAIATLPLLAGCTGGGGMNTLGSHPTSPPVQQSFVYYATNNMQVGVIAYPITSSSTLAGVLTNTIVISQNLAFDPSGRLYVVNNSGPPFTISVFAPPSTVASFVLTLPASVTGCIFGDAFDASGNLWVTDPCTSKVFEFNGPFTTSTTLNTNITLTSPLPPPEGIAFDPAGNLYVSLPQSGTTHSVEVWLKGSGFTSGQAVDHYLKGLTNTIGLTFDKTGNLYASSTAQGIGEYFSSNLGANAVPNVFDTTGLLAGYNPWQMTTDSFGNLYVADCSFSATAKIYVYATSSGGLTPTLAPLTYSDSDIVAALCASGIAIH